MELRSHPSIVSADPERGSGARALREDHPNSHHGQSKGDLCLDGRGPEEEQKPPFGDYPSERVVIVGDVFELPGIETGGGDDWIYIDIKDESDEYGAVLDGIATGGGDDVIYINSDDSHEVRHLHTGSGDDTITTGAGLSFWSIDTGSGDDIINSVGFSALGNVDMGTGDDQLNITQGVASDVDFDFGDDTLNADGRTSIGLVFGGSGNDTFNVSGEARIREIFGGSGDDTVTIDATEFDDAFNLSGNTYDGGDGDETNGDTFTMIYDGTFETVTFDPATGIYTVTTDEGATFTITNFETINWPDGFDPSSIIILNEPDPTANTDPVDVLFFDPVTSALMIEEAAAKAAQDDADNVEHDIWA